MGKTTAVVWPNGKAYFFQGDQYTRYDIDTDRADDGYPQPINSGWAGVFPSDIDAAVVWPNGKAYFFHADQYTRYDIDTDRADDGYPQPINSGWAGVFPSDIDAAVVWPNGKAYFFHADQYTRYDIDTDRADDGYPQPINSGWAGVFPSDIDAAVVWPNGKAYFFHADQYTRYDIDTDRADDGYPQPINTGWAGLTFTTPSGPQPQPQPAPAAGAGAFSFAFSFQLTPGEAVGSRIVRCCHTALDAGPMGQNDRHDFYRDFIACNQEASPEKAEQLTHVRTSCALFVRAVREWCGAPPAGPYMPGTPMFKSMGDVSFAHPAFRSNDGSSKPNPGDYFYISSTQSSNDGHTGIFIAETADGVWQTAEGGGGGPTDGTLCRLTERTIAGNKFSNDNRTLWGWFDCTEVGLPT